MNTSNKIRHFDYFKLKLAKIGWSYLQQKTSSILKDNVSNGNGK